MTDIPEHLIDAYWSTKYKDNRAQVVAAVLAALRPEDAHLIPAWKQDRRALEDARVAGWSYKRQRDEARAEVERLTAENARLREALRGVVKSQEALP